ncbi:hypothetical protein [Oceanicoccus sp. KOV_DT_Chl]|uniref:hypothetical protein n=1 Tax=Oceanicoccus sp. KOV_DT_Chl TaxID=1904639 RepID=UPI000C7C4AA2|nr:hypothetical protein [Oceanicoccus sp. KOV_DT_Chl]
MVNTVNHPNGGILVDALHLHRNGHTPSELLTIKPQLLPYWQLCDASAAQPKADDIDALLEDALQQRLLPGEGELPLQQLYHVMQDKPISVEIRSRALAAHYPTPLARAKAVYDSTRLFLDRSQQA